MSNKHVKRISLTLIEEQLEYIKHYSSIERLSTNIVMMINDNMQSQQDSTQQEQTNSSNKI